MNEKQDDDEYFIEPELLKKIVREQRVEKRSVSHQIKRFVGFDPNWDLYNSYHRRRGPEYGYAFQINKYSNTYLIEEINDEINGETTLGKNVDES